MLLVIINMNNTTCLPDYSAIIMTFYLNFTLKYAVCYYYFPNKVILLHVQDWNVITLRYFNPVGAHKSGDIGEDPQVVKLVNQSGGLFVH